MARRQVILTFTPETSSQPIIYNLGQQFNIVTNIRQAEASEDRGWIALELDGQEDDIEAGIAWVISKGIRIEPTGE